MLHPTWVFVLEPQPASALRFQFCPQLSHSDQPGPPALPGPMQSVKGPALSPAGPTTCELSRATGLLSSWKQAGSQENPSPKDLFTPTCLEVGPGGPRGLGEGSQSSPSRLRMVFLVFSKTVFVKNSREVLGLGNCLSPGRPWLCDLGQFNYLLCASVIFCFCFFFYRKIGPHFYPT